MLPSELTNTIELLIGMKHISPTFRYIMPMYLRLTTFTKTLLQMSFHLFFVICFRSGAPIITLMTSGALTELQLQMCARLMQGWVESAGWPPPNKNPGYASAWHVSRATILQSLTSNPVLLRMQSCHLKLGLALLLFPFSSWAYAILSRRSSSSFNLIHSTLPYSSHYIILYAQLLPRIIHSPPIN